MAQTTDPTKVAEIKDVVAKDLEEITSSFNNMLRAWEDRTSCNANFAWRYNDKGKKILVADEIVMPVVVKKVSEEVVREVEKVLSEAETIKCSPQ